MGVAAMLRLSIQAACCGEVDAALGDAVLKRYLQRQYGINARRLSRLSMLALAGGLGAAAQAGLPAHGNIYMGGAFSSPSVFQSMMSNVLEEQVAMPFDFLANIHNAPVFHLATALGCHGAGVFLPLPATGNAWAQPLLLEANDIAQGIIDSALVGWCYEAPPTAASSLSGSHWLLLQRAPLLADKPGPELHLLRTAAVNGAAAAAPAVGDYYFAAVAAAFAHLNRDTEHTVSVSPAASLAWHGAGGFEVQTIDWNK